MTRHFCAAAICVALTGPVMAIEDQMSIPWEDSARVEEGQALFAANCAACHGDTMAGGAVGDVAVPALDGTGHASHHDAMHLFTVVHDGAAALPGGDPQSPMMGFGDQLSDDEILSILAHIKANWPEEVRMAHDGGHAH